MPTFKCHTCGWRWEAGQSGNHDCIPRLVEQRDSVLGEWRLLKKRVAECYQRLGEAKVMGSRKMIDGINTLIAERDEADAMLDWIEKHGRIPQLHENAIGTAHPNLRAALRAALRTP